MKCDHPDCGREQVCGGPWCWEHRDAALDEVRSDVEPRLCRGDSGASLCEQTRRACGCDPWFETEDG